MKASASTRPYVGLRSERGTPHHLSCGSVGKGSYPHSKTWGRAAAENGSNCDAHASAGHRKWEPGAATTKFHRRCTSNRGAFHLRGRRRRRSTRNCERAVRKAWDLVKLIFRPIRSKLDNETCLASSKACHPRDWDGTLSSKAAADSLDKLKLKRDASERASDHLTSPLYQPLRGEAAYKGRRGQACMGNEAS